MKWQSHQRHGYFGLTTEGQPLHRKRVDINQALERSETAVQLHMEARAHAPAPMFTGGVHDAWPAWAVDALAVAKQEEAAISRWRAAEEQKQAQQKPR